MTTTTETTPLADATPAIEGLVYNLPSSASDAAVAAISKANTRLARHGIAERFTATFTPYIRTRTVDGVTTSSEWVRVELNAPSFALGDWEFVAALHAEEGGMMVRNVPGRTLEGWDRPDAHLCQHCNTRRRRNRSYVLRNRASNEFIQVGHNCLELFTGVKVRGLWVLEFDLDDVADEWLREDSGFSRAEPMYEVRELLALGWVASNGGRAFVTRSAANESQTATADDVLEIYFACGNISISRERAASARAMVVAARALLEETPDVVDAIIKVADDLHEGDYADNVRVALGSEYITRRSVGILLSLIAVFRKREPQEALPAIVEEYLGDEGDKLTGIDATVTTASEFETHYSYPPKINTLIVFRTDSGHQIKWAASSVQDVDKGDRVRIERATVKCQAVYNDHAQTVVTRVKMSPIEQAVDLDTPASTT